MSSPLDTPPHLSPRDPGTTREEPESARLRFRGFCYQEAAGPREALAQLRELCRQWLRPEAHSKEQMLELLVLEQFLVTLPPEIQAWVRGQQPSSPEEAAALVEGLQHDPGQLLDWITAHILKQKELPAAQKEESLGNPHSSGIMEPPGSALGEGPQDSGMEEPGQLSCSVKEEPDADVQEMAPPSSMSLAQSPEEHLRHQEPASIPSNPPSIQEQWGLLDPSQKELYWDAMLEKYGTVVSLGFPRALGSQAGSGAGAGTPCAGTRLHGGLGPAGQDQGRPEAQPPRGPGPVSREGPCRAPASARLTCPGTPPAHAAPSSPGRKRYTCEQCGRGFDWKSVFVIHHRTHLGGPSARAPSPARAAEEQGPREQAALRSPRRGPGPRSYECEECGRGFSWKSQLVIHRKSHTGQRRHCCRDCGRGFDWKSQLVIHRKSHRPEAP